MASWDRHGFLVVTCSVSLRSCVLGPGPSEISNAHATWESPRKANRSQTLPSISWISLHCYRIPRSFPCLLAHEGHSSRPQPACKSWLSASILGACGTQASGERAGTPWVYSLGIGEDWAEGIQTALSFQHPSFPQKYRSQKPNWVDSRVFLIPQSMFFLLNCNVSVKRNAGWCVW